MIGKSSIYIIRIFSMLLGVYMLNLSVDTADHEGDFDGSVNEIESIVELVYEVVLDHPNYLPEQDEPDPELAYMLANLFYDVSLTHISIKRPFILVEPLSHKDKIVLYLAPFFGSPTPPPDVVCSNIASTPRIK